MQLNKKNEAWKAPQALRNTDDRWALKLPWFLNTANVFVFFIYSFWAREKLYLVNCWYI